MVNFKISENTKLLYIYNTCILKLDVYLCVLQLSFHNAYNSHDITEINIYKCYGELVKHIISTTGI